MDLGISIFRQGIFCYFTYEYSGESRAKILGLWISMLETWWGIFVSMALNILDIVKVSNFKSNLGMLQHFSTDLFPAEWRTKEPPGTTKLTGQSWRCMIKRIGKNCGDQFFCVHVFSIFRLSSDPLDYPCLRYI